MVGGIGGGLIVGDDYVFGWWIVGFGVLEGGMDGVVVGFRVVVGLG